MRTLPIALAGTLALLAGCGGTRADAPAAPAAPLAVALPIDLLGTWSDPAGAGFIAFGARQTVIAVDGAPRVVAPAVENAIEPGMSAGKIGLAGGTALFLARGSAPVNGLPVDLIEVEIVNPDGKSVRRRLFSETGLRMAARLPAAAPAPIAATAVADPDAIFIAAVPGSRRPLAEHLVARAKAGAPPAELAATFGDRQRTTFAAILVLVGQARNLDPLLAAERLAEADQRRAESESFAQAVRTWMAGRG
jgi:hypothetical protein